MAAFLQTALRLDKPALLAWLADELGRPPLSVDLSGLTLTEADIARLRLMPDDAMAGLTTSVEVGRLPPWPLAGNVIQQRNLLGRD